MTNEKREQIITHILTQVDRKGSIDVQTLVETFGVSKSTVYNYIAKLKETGEIYSIGDNAEMLFLKDTIPATRFFYDASQRLSEMDVFVQDIQPLIQNLPTNAVRIWKYAFSEMMNNAIEHSLSKKILVIVQGNKVSTEIIIQDKGIGVFESIRRYQLEKTGEDLTYSECLSLLMPGKFTTKSENHSGEGIFFTSKMVDRFVLIANGIIYRRNEFYEKATASDTEKTGTLLIMELSNTTSKTPMEILDRYSSAEEGFYRTEIPLRYMFPGKEPVARSEARRLCAYIEDFSEAILDFSEIGFVGQAFAHELFVVWQKNNPDKKLIVENACDDVMWMINRVLNTK